jgi:hypothetical protein
MYRLGILIGWGCLSPRHFDGDPCLTSGEESVGQEEVELCRRQKNLEKWDSLAYCGRVDTILQ